MLKDSAAFSGFAVDDLAAAKDFYEGTLGLEVSDESAGLELVLSSGARVFIYPKGEQHRPAEYTILNFSVDDIEAAVDAMGERGVAFEVYDGMGQDERGIMNDGHGPRIAWFKDPAGNILSVLEG